MRTELFIPIGANCPVRIKDLGRRRSTVLNYLDGSTEFVVDENWLQDENDRGGNHEWTGETHFDCDFDQIDEDEAEIYDNEEYEPECNDGPDFVLTYEVEVEETSVTTALPAEKKERDFIKIEEDPKFAPSSKPGLFLGYRLEPGGLWKGDYLVADLEHIQRGLRKPSIHQVKRIWKNPEEPYVFPMLASYDARTRTIREAIADRRADLKPSKKIRDEFDFDEGRFDDPDDDDDDDDDRQDEGGDSSSKSDGANQSKAVQGGGDACISDYWERHDEDSAWYRIHVEVQKKFFGATNEDLPPGGPSHEELDTVRVTHMRGLDAVGNWIRDDRHHDAPNHRHFTRGFWTGVTILFEHCLLKSLACRGVDVDFQANLMFKDRKDIRDCRPLVYPIRVVRPYIEAMQSDDEAEDDQRTTRSKRNPAGRYWQSCQLLRTRRTPGASNQAQDRGGPLGSCRPCQHGP